MRALVFAVTVVAFAAPARADKVEEARREFAAGQDADARHDWQSAIAHFLRANDLVPHPNAVYNIARDYEQLGQLREAARWFARYLELQPDAAEKAKVEAHAAGLIARPSKLSVHSTPDAAHVTIDGVQVGVTPYAGVVPAGTHRIAADKDSEHGERDITVEYGEPADVELALSTSAATLVTPRAPTGETGTLVVRGPPGAQVLVDGTAMGTTPAQLRVAAGPHVVAVTSFGFAPFITQSTVAAGQVVQVEAPLAPITTLPTTPRAVWLIGGTGGVDVNTGTAVGIGELGVRIGRRFDILLGFGSIGGGFATLTSLRYAFFTSRVTPYLGVGFLLGTDPGFAVGFQASGGVRWDIVRGETKTLSLLVEAGYRIASVSNLMTASSGNVTGVPITGALEVTFGGRQ